MRYEKKYEIPISHSKIISNYLISLGFNEIYKSRVVTSLYYDDPYFSNYNQSINGVSLRTKIRARYYDFNKSDFNIEFKKKQEELLTETLKKIDIIICTALIPGREAPKIIKEDMFKNLQPGSVIYDLAAVQGGNTTFTEVDKIVEKNGVKILGEANILNKLPVSASNLYAKNVFNFISNLYDKENKKLNINLEDEIIEKTLIK